MENLSILTASSCSDVPRPPTSGIIYEELVRYYGKSFGGLRVDEYFIVNKDDSAAWELRKQCKCKVIPFSRKEELVLGCFVKEGNIVIIDEEKTLVEFFNVTLKK